MEKKRGGRTDFWLLGSAIFLVFFGLLAIYDASVVSAFRDFGDKFYYIKNQIIWASLGAVALGFFSIFDYHKLLKLAPHFLLLCTVLLVAVLIPHIGTKIYGARRWINIGGFNFQPSELSKLALIFYQTSIMSKFENFKIRLSDTFVVFLLPALVAAGLIFLEPDFGTAIIVMAVTMSVYFLASAPIWHFLLALPPLLAAAVLAILVEPYRLARLKSFLDPTHDPQGASYQINQILTAINRGGFLGVGIGQSRSKFAFIPEVQTDAIFAIIAEEIGTIGVLFLLSVFCFILSRAVNIARGAKDPEGKLLALGLIFLIVIQALFNIASNVALVPLTGVPMPFISYGGSSLIVMMTSVGILINIGRQSK